MANQTVTVAGLDVNAVQECIDKARSIIAMMGPYSISTFGYESAQDICGSAWAATDQLDKLAQLCGLDERESVEG